MNLLKWGRFSFYVMVDLKIFTYLKNKKQLIVIANKKLKIFDFKWNFTPCYRQWNCLEWSINLFNSLIVWNNLVWNRRSTYGESRWLICTSRNWKPSQSKILKQNVKKFKKLLTYFLCNNIWSENFLFYHKTCFPGKA